MPLDSLHSRGLLGNPSIGSVILLPFRPFDLDICDFALPKHDFLDQNQADNCFQCLKLIEVVKRKHFSVLVAAILGSHRGKTQQKLLKFSSSTS